MTRLFQKETGRDPPCRSVKSPFNISDGEENKLLIPISVGVNGIYLGKESFTRISRPTFLHCNSPPNPADLTLPVIVIVARVRFHILILVQCPIDGHCQLVRPLFCPFSSPACLSHHGQKCKEEKKGGVIT